MSTDEYVPSDEDWVPTEEEVRHFSRAWLAEGDFDRFLARVRRDAAREALDGLAEEVLSEWNMQHRWIVKPIDEYCDTHYPETEDQT